MIVNLISDINTESVLKAFSGRSSISIAEFYRGPYFNNVTESNYSGLKLRKTIDSLVNGYFIESLDGYEPSTWRITKKGLDHLAFLELPNVKEIEKVKVVTQHASSFRNFEIGSMIRRNVAVIGRFMHALTLPVAGRNQKAE